MTQISVVPFPGKRAYVSLLSPCSLSFLGLLPDYNTQDACSAQGLGCMGRGRLQGGTGAAEWLHSAGSDCMVASSYRGRRCSGLSEACLRGAGLAQEPLQRAKEWECNGRDLRWNPGYRVLQRAVSESLP